VEIAYHYTSCEAVGGDFYDMIIHGENLISFIIGDVSGKGVGAALFMEHIKTLLQSYVPRFKNPRTSVSELNRKILNEKRLVMFATVLIVQLEMENRSFRFASAGHNRQFILRASTKTVDVISGKGAPCGAFSEDKYQEFVLPYEEGDYLFLYTDGFTEAMNSQNEVFGIEKLEDVLKDLIRSTGELTPKIILARVLADVNNFTKRTPLQDDQTALVVKL
jgi:serine phosphatase RsbU (regulator of sigma subunit)